MSGNASRKAVFGWVFYDWANSAFALTVMSGIFPLFFKQYWCKGADVAVSTTRLAIGTAIAGIIIAFFAPFLGALADAKGKRKAFLAVFMLAGSIATALLAGIAQGQWIMAMTIFIVANIGFAGANLFYDSLLVNVSPPEKMDSISSIGFAIGYLGCAVLFAVNILMVTKPALFGLADSSYGVKASFFSVAIWWSLFSIPLLLWVKEPKKESLSFVNTLRTAYTQLRQTFSEIRHSRSILLFLLAYWFYIDGVHTFIRMAADFGLSMGLSGAELMKALLIVQLVAFPAALLFGSIAGRIGTLPSLIIGIVLYVFVTIAGTLVLKTPGQFIFFAVISAIPQGCLQALSRSFYARMIPPERSAEYFGFYDLIGKSAIFIGPAIIALVTFVARKHGMMGESAVRSGFGSILLLFIIGCILLVMAARNKSVAYGN